MQVCFELGHPNLGGEKVRVQNVTGCGVQGCNACCCTKLQPVNPSLQQQVPTPLLNTGSTATHL